jgi:glycosyltransferase involved in cell wall biosynthesis
MNRNGTLIAVADPAPRVSVVIPTLNEERNLPHVFGRLPGGLHEVIVVDGHSADDTVEVARRLRPDVRIVMQPGRGKGNALAAGFAACTGDIVVMMDADGSTDPAEIPRFVNALYRTSYTDLCYGFNAFWARCLPYMRVDCDGFEVETLVNVRIAKAGLTIHEVPSYERVRLYGHSHLNAVRDGARVLRTIALERTSGLQTRRFRARVPQEGS